MLGGQGPVILRRVISLDDRPARMVATTVSTTGVDVTMRSQVVLGGSGLSAGLTVVGSLMAASLTAKDERRAAGDAASLSACGFYGRDGENAMTWDREMKSLAAVRGPAQFCEPRLNGGAYFAGRSPPAWAWSCLRNPRNVGSVLSANAFRSGSSP